MQRNLTRIGLVNLVLLLLAGAVGLFISRQSGSYAGQAGMAFLGAGLLVAILSWFQMRLEDRERLEKLELEELARSAKGSTLFDTGDARYTWLNRVMAVGRGTTDLAAGQVSYDVFVLG